MEHDVAVGAAEPDALDRDVRDMVARVVGNDRRVLTVGITDPDLVDALRRRGCDVTADPETDPPDGAAEAAFDVVLIGDVLAETVEPQDLLVRAEGLLGEGGRVVITVANRAHADRALEVLYAAPGPDGPLPDHPPALTFDRILDLLAAAELSPVAIDRTTVPVFGTPRAVPPAEVPPAVRDAVVRVAESDTYRFAVAAEPLPQVFDLESVGVMVLDERAAARRRAARAADDLLRSDVTVDGHDTVDSLQAKLTDLQQELGLAREQLQASAEAESTLRGVQERLEHLMAYQSDLSRSLGGVDGSALHDVILGSVGELREELRAGLEVFGSTSTELSARMDVLATGLGEQAELAERLRLMIEQQGQTLAELTGRIEGVEGRTAPLGRRLEAKMRRDAGGH